MDDTLDLADYRRRVSDLYAAARGSLDPAVAWTRWRSDRDTLLSTHPQSAVPAAQRAIFDGSPFFDYEPSWRLVAEVEPAETDTVMIDNSGTGATRFVHFGTAHATAAGGPLALEVYWLDSYGGGLFLPFRDRTNGSQTYGGGRYLLDSAKGADLGGEGGQLILDFNFSYHPSCVWDDRWSCPLAPPGNHLDVDVLAGERLA
jgi:uncharacterized protein (DUF1684 family)